MTAKPGKSSDFRHQLLKLHKPTHPMWHRYDTLAISTKRKMPQSSWEKFFSSREKPKDLL